MKNNQAKFNENRRLHILVGCYAGFWIALAIKPLDRSDWLLENILVFVTAAVLVFSYRRLQFSNASYVLIILFLALHTVGAHYTYTKVPAGFWIQNLFHLKRNHFDRIIHFAFGLLLIYPLQELLHRAAGVRAGWFQSLALVSIAAMSSFFEILEAIIAQIVRPDLGAAYLGTQGDIWDAQKDMMAAIIGAVLATIAINPLRKLRK